MVKRGPLNFPRLTDIPPFVEESPGFQDSPRRPIDIVFEHVDRMVHNGL
jgi:hypothetical protein